MQKRNCSSTVGSSGGIILAISWLAWSAFAQSVPALINYQGKLTDQSGIALSAGVYGIQFRLWDTPIGSNVLIWAQQQSVSIQSSGGFNVILGAPGGNSVPGATPAVNDLSFAFTSSNRYLGLTVALSNGVAVQSAIEILPRQQLLSAPFALMAGQVANGAIGSQQIADGAVTLMKLASRPSGTNVLAGGIAVSPSSGDFKSPANETFVDVTNLSVQIVTTGRPVVLMLQPALGSTDDCFVGGESDGVRSDPFASFRFSFEGGDLSPMSFNNGASAQYLILPPTLFVQIHFPGPGPHVYKFRAHGRSASGAYAIVYNCVLVAFEL